jgi:hypothetical protein
MLAVGCAIDALAFADVPIAVGAAISLQKIDVELLAPSLSRICDLMEDWSVRRIPCDQCGKPFSGARCGTCRLVTPTPRRYLFSVVCQSGALSVEDLLRFASDDDTSIREEACQQVARMIAQNEPARERVFEMVRDGLAPAPVLVEILKLPTGELRRFSDDLLGLLTFGPALVRARIVEALGGNWLSAEEGRRWATKHLTDIAPEVRSQAVRVLRQFSQAG